jgi:hypothetical protein
MTMKKVSMGILFSFLMVTSHSQLAGTSQDFQKMKWLIGGWEGKTSSGSPFYESWKLFNDSVLVNFNIEIRNTDTIVKESGAIFIHKGKICMGSPDRYWNLSRLTNNEMVFQNDSINYSNTIIWVHSPDDRWFAILQNPGSTIVYDLHRSAAIERKTDEFIRSQIKNSP